MKEHVGLNEHGQLYRKSTGEVIVGSLTPKGYRNFKIKGKTYLVHRVVHFLDTGEWPDQVDHKDGVYDHNHPDNLRSADNSQNGANRKASGVSRFLGVSLHKRGKWLAQLRKDGKVIYLGLHTCEAAAAVVYARAAKLHHKEYASHCIS